MFKSRSLSWESVFVSLIGFVSVIFKLRFVLNVKVHFVSFSYVTSVDAPFCLGYFVLFLIFVGPRAHLHRVSSLGLGPLPFLFIESLIYFVFN